MPSPPSSPSRFLGSAPVLLVRDVVAAANYYRDVLGFSYERFWGEPPGFVIVKRDGFSVMLKRADRPEDVIPNRARLEHTWDAFFWIVEVDALHAELVQRGATIEYPPCNQPYEIREFAVLDLDGHSLAFGETL